MLIQIFLQSSGEWKTSQHEHKFYLTDSYYLYQFTQNFNSIFGVWAVYIFYIIFYTLRLYAIVVLIRNHFSFRSKKTKCMQSIRTDKWGKSHKFSDSAKQLWKFSRENGISNYFFLRIYNVVVVKWWLLLNFFRLRFLLIFIHLLFFLLYPQYSYHMHQKYETAIKATHDNSRAIIELHEVHMLILCINIVMVCVRVRVPVCFFHSFRFVCLFICLVFNTNQTRCKLKNKYDRVQCIHTSLNCSS